MADQIAMVKTLTSTDANSSLVVPMGSLQHFALAADDNLRFTVVDINNDQKFILSLRIRNQGYLKPVIGGDWRSYARGKELRTGDRVIFHFNINDDGNISFSIQAQRTDFTFNGEHLWYDL